MNQLFIYLVIASLFIMGCSNGLPENKKAEFTTRITSNGLKHFQVRIIPAGNHQQDHQAPPPTRRAGSRQPSDEKPDRTARQNEKALIMQAETELALNGFCHNGFWILDKNTYDHTPWIRGECNEAATTQDRANFPDTLTRW